MSNEFKSFEYHRYPVRRGKVLTITGGKGGTGKTNVAVNLSIALAQRRKSVVIMDADIGLANVEVVLGLKSKNTLQAVIEGKAKVTDVLAYGPNGIKVVPGVSGLGHLANLDKDGQRNVRLAMEELQAQFDYVVIDTMAGIGPASVAFAVAADQTLLVTTPEPSALMDAYAMVKMVRGLNPGAVIMALVNMADDEDQALRAYNNMSAACSKYLDIPVEYAGFVLRDQSVRKAALQSYPFTLLYPNAPVSRAIRELASTLLHETFVETKDTRPGFIQRFARSMGVAMF